MRRFYSSSRESRFRGKNSKFHKSGVNENFSFLVTILIPLIILSSGWFLLIKASFFGIGDDIQIFGRWQDMAVRAGAGLALFIPVGSFWYIVHLLRTNESNWIKKISYCLFSLILSINFLRLKVVLLKSNFYMGLWIEFAIFLVAVLIYNIWKSFFCSKMNLSKTHKDDRSSCLVGVGVCGCLLILEIILAYCFKSNVEFAKGILLMLLSDQVQGIVSWVWIIIVPGFMLSFLFSDKIVQIKNKHIVSCKLIYTIGQIKKRFLTVGYLIGSIFVIGFLVAYVAVFLTMTQSVYKFDRPIENKESYPIKCYVVVWEDNNQYCLEPAVVDNDGLHIYTSVNQWVSREDILTYKSTISIIPAEIYGSNELPKEMWNVIYSKKSTT